MTVFRTDVPLSSSRSAQKKEMLENMTQTPTSVQVRAKSPALLLWVWQTVLRASSGMTLGQAAEETALWESGKKSHLASPAPLGRFLTSSTPSLPFPELLQPCLHLDMYLSDEDPDPPAWLPSWPQTCLTTVTCLAITGLCWPQLLPPDLLCSVVWLLWGHVSCGQCCPWLLCCPPRLLACPPLWRSPLLLPLESRHSKNPFTEWCSCAAPSGRGMVSNC